MNSINLGGTIHSDKIELRSTPDGTPVTSFKLKVKRDYKKNHSSDDCLYDYITVVCWNNMALLVVNTYKKNDKVMVKGSIRSGRRKLKEYKVYKDGVEQVNFQVPVFEVYAQHVEKM